MLLDEGLDDFLLRLALRADHKGCGRQGTIQRYLEQSVLYLCPFSDIVWKGSSQCRVKFTLGVGSFKVSLRRTFDVVDIAVQLDRDIHRAVLAQNLFELSL